MLRILQMAGEVVVRERRHDEHRRIERDAEPLDDRHELPYHLLTKDNPDADRYTAEVVFPGIL